VPLELAVATDRWVGTGVILGVAAALVLAGHVLIRARTKDRYTRFHAGHVLRYGVALAAAFALAVNWEAFAGHAVVFVGLLSAGLAFALQELVGAIAGWFNIMLGRLYRVGDRVHLSGVDGDVIDVSLLRTKLMEIGAPDDAGGGAPPNPVWVKGRQHTGRIVAVSNKATFTDPVYNYSGVFEYIWEELRIGVPYADDWKAAEAILLDEARRVSASEGAQQAIRQMAQRHPVPAHEVEPQVYVELTDNWTQLTARFVIPVRSSRTVKSDMARRIRERLDAAGIAVASATSDVTLHPGPGWPGAGGGSGAGNGETGADGSAATTTAGRARQ
jgi:small-conductance mechanosensitive channel